MRSRSEGKDVQTMNGWAEGIQSAVQYIEDNLADEIDISEAAARAYVSEFYFRRIFSVLYGMTVGEYIRNRRLTLAAQELANTDIKVIDAALKYGYDSPDSFARAFSKFHGISPSAAKDRGASLKFFAPVRIKLTLEGGSMLEYKIVKKAAFTVMGKSRRFNTDTSYAEIPKFWEEHFRSEDCKVICGMYGVCLDCGGKDFDYLIADNYIPQNDIPEGCVTVTIPEGEWAVFSCRGPLSKSLQDVNTRIWSEWLPNCREYKLAGNYNIEMYTPPCDDPEKTYSEIWVPVVKASER